MNLQVHMAQAKPAQGPQIKYTAGILPEFDAEDVDDSVSFNLSTIPK